MSVRVRFAPSPTGYLHIGGARTAIFNWLYARHTGGTFVLRIEDTDDARNTQEAVDVILDGLRWLGLDWDEGPTSGDNKGPSKGPHGPYFQSARADVYKRRIQELKDKDLAYEHEGAVRFRMQREPVVIPDLVVGNVTRELTDREKMEPDFVIVRSDGNPVFHLVNVIDDIEMGITHVIRGEDHLSNTAKHIALFRAFGAEPPQFAHIPLILNTDKSKMSKRDTGAALSGYMDGGCAPEALVNYLCLLSWSPKGNREIIPLEEVVQLFDLPQVVRHNASFDIDKLHWINGEYIRLMTLERFEELSRVAFAKAGMALDGFAPDYVRTALKTCQEKIKSFSEMPAFGGFYFAEVTEYDAAGAAKSFVPENRPRIQQLRDAFAALPAFDAAMLEASLKNVAAALAVKTGLLIHPTRLATTGRTVGPSLYHLLEALGKDRVLQRLDAAIAVIG
jgi:glutamyl-tRNA synthetase